MIRCSYHGDTSLVSESEILTFIQSNRDSFEQVRSKAAWSDGLLDWFSVETGLPADDLKTIRRLADYVRRHAEVLIVIGIGGSNRAAAAACSALLQSQTSPTKIFFAGDTLSAAEMHKAIELAQTKSVMLNVIAKDFHTVEPGVTFRMLRQVLQKRYKDDYAKRIIATGSFGPEQLEILSQRHGYWFVPFPEQVGGRFSALTTVGLLPMAVAGIDIDAMLSGAASMERSIKDAPLADHAAFRYTALRFLLLRRGYPIEALALFEPSLQPLGRWWVQLFGETEGKRTEVLFPTYVSYSEDLHALGQFVQQGPRTIIETFLRYTHEASPLCIAPSPEVKDGFEYLDEKPFDALNDAVYAAALRAHSSDGIPCIELALDEPIHASSLGAVFYFFMFCAYLSATLLEVNPFNQEGVELYKKNMYAVLGKTHRI